MLLIVDLDTQNIVDDPGISGARSDISIPRASSVELSVQFARGGVVVDPELGDTDIETSTTGAGTIFRAPGHSFIVGDTISISDHTGLPIEIVSAGANIQTVTMTSANPGVVSVLGYAVNDEVVFSTTGVLPDNIVAGTRYFVIATGLTSSACQVSSTIGGSGINTTAGTQSGVHTATNLSRSRSAVSLITTSADHGMTTGGNGTAADGSALAAGKFLVEISGHQTAQDLSGAITTSSAATPTVITTTLAHGLTTGDLVTISGNVSTVNVTSMVVVTSATTFTFTGVTSAGGSGGTFLRAASDINGTHVATCLSSTLFTIPKRNNSLLREGTVTVTTTTPTANTADGAVWRISAVTANTFTLNYAGVDGYPSMTLTAAGAGGRASKTTTLALRWTVKPDGDYDGPVVASTTNFVKSGSGSTTIFTGTCNYITTELNSLLGIDATTTGTFAVSISSTTFTASSTHGLAVGDTITFSAATTMPAGLVAGQVYYVLTVPTTVTFTVAATAAGTAISPTTTGTGALTYVAYLTADDATRATLMAELSWTGAKPSKTNWIQHYLRNDLYKAGDTTPVSANGQTGRTTIGSGVSEKAVVFSPALYTSAWHFVGAPTIWNTTASALGISFMGLTAKSDTGFTAILSGTTNATGTYYLDWTVEPD